MAAIDIGAAAIDRAAYVSGNSTCLDLTNPANATGTITSVQVYINTAVTGNFRVGTFYLVSGTDYKCRSSVGLGALAVGLNTINGLSLPVVAGDFIGWYFTGSGAIDRTDYGGSSAFVSGEYIDAGDQATYTAGVRLYSLYGTGTEAPVAFKGSRGFIIG